MITDHTTAFRALLPAGPSASNGSNTSGPSSRPDSPSASPDTRRSGSSSKRVKGNKGHRHTRESEAEVKAREAEEAFMGEAYRIHQHLSTLRTSLSSTRKAYLSLAEGPSIAVSRFTGGAETRRSRLRSQRHSVAENGAKEEEAPEGEDADEDDAWLNGRLHQQRAHMSDKERQEVDMRGKMIVRRCRDRVAALEEGEKARQSRTLPATHVNPLLSLLHALSADSSPSTSSSGSATTSEPIIAAHRASVLWTLNSLLASTSKDLVDLQEERAKRKAERVRTLGDGAEREARAVAAEKARKREGFFGRALDGIAGNGNGNGSSSTSVSGSNGLPPDADGTAAAAADPAEPTLDPSLSSLSAEQIQAFDSENSALLTHLSSTLSSVLAAEKSLLEISEMQTQLITHLAQQTELVDTLYEQAVGSVSEMRGAKEQLVKARERSGEARLFLLVFLIGASLGLLFLDWYS